MVTCKKCGYVGSYIQEPCPLCHTKFELTSDEVKAELDELRTAVKNKEFDKAADGYRMLAEDGYTEAEKEYAKILEKGLLVPRNYNLAMEYFYRAAKKNDAYAAYRYSRLLSRESDDLSLFWLIYSAILGCVEAHPLVAEEFAKKGYYKDACYFYSLASDAGDAESTVRIARMYYDGIGVEKSAEHAKWYMDKLKIPPIYAIKLAYNLRGVSAKKPAPAHPKTLDGVLYRLKNQARDRGFGPAYLKLSEILADRGDADSVAVLGCALIQGNGFPQDFTKGLKMLIRAAAMNSVFANTSLAELYHSAKYTEKDIKLALTYYDAAGRLGSAASYEAAGDIYSKGEEIEIDYAKATDYYNRALKLGSLSALRKYDEIKQQRGEIYTNATVLEGTLPDKAFELYKTAADMGHAAATHRLAVCYEFGIGTKKDRRRAFALYQTAVSLGDYDALLPLGICYANGIGTKLDYRKAKDTLSKAERIGIVGVKNVIRVLMEQKKKKFAKRYYSQGMQLIYMKKFDAAKNHLEAAAELMNPRAIYTLGCLYEFGMGATCDKDKAFSLYEKSYSLFFRDPRSNHKLSVLRMLKSK
ncbi:MAG: sel1 repeat family protein [Ruminococcaceae bacterium]|nr:sel1 repeat family protein [Oscillospiraceae bacterium]